MLRSHQTGIHSCPPLYFELQQICNRASNFRLTRLQHASNTNAFVASNLRTLFFVVRHILWLSYSWRAWNSHPSLYFHLHQICICPSMLKRHKLPSAAFFWHVSSLHPLVASNPRILLFLFVRQICDSHTIDLEFSGFTFILRSSLC